MRATPLLSFLVLVAASAPTRASACSPQLLAQIERTRPSGDAWPANAPLVFEGGQLGLGGSLVATIDGVPAALEIDERRSWYVPTDYGYHVLVVRLRPTPEPGQTVRVEGQLCWSGCALAMEYVATAPLEEDVPPIDALRWDLEEHQREENAYGEDSCGTHWYPLAEVMTRALVPAFDALESWHRLEVSVSRGAGEVVARRTLGPRDGYAVANFGLGQDRVGYPADLAGLCVSARLLTLTGEGPLTTVCEPCRVRGPTDPLSCAPAGAHCPFEAPDSSLEEPPPACGGCAVGSRPVAPEGILGGLVLALLWTSRRGPRRTRSTM